METINLNSNAKTSRRNCAKSTTAVGYLRRSTDRQEQSIPDQRKAVEHYAAENGLRLERLFIDDAISGTSATGRRAFQEMIAEAQRPEHPFSYVVVYDVKRFGRVDNDEAGYYRHILKTHGVEVIYVSENFSGDGTDDLLRPVKQWQAREESKDLSKVTIRGLLSKVQGGWWMGGAPPYGYDLRYENDRQPKGEFLFVSRFMPDGTKQMLDERGRLIRTLDRGGSINISKRDRARLVPSSSDRVEVVRRIFKMSAEENKGFRSIAETLNNDKIPTPRGPSWARIYNGLWTASTIRAILVSPVYAGDMVWNRRTDARFHKISGGRAVERKDAYGARLVPNPEEDWILVRDAHPALIDHRLFRLAQETREARPTTQKQRGRNSRVTGGWKGQRARFLLSGLVQCARCGGRYEGCRRTKGKPRQDGSKVHNFYYGCGSYIRRGKTACRFGPVDQAALEAAVASAVVGWYQRYLEDGEGKVLARAIREIVGPGSNDVSEARRRAEEELEGLRRSLSNLLDNITAANRDYVDERLAKLGAERELVERRIEEFDRMALSSGEIETLVQETWDFVRGLEFVLEKGPPEERIRSVRQCIESIVIAADTTGIVLCVRVLPSARLRSAIDEVRITLGPIDLPTTLLRADINQGKAGSHA
jgi:DNA invertase Pin-like site-specific DNA recombinase